MKKFSLFLLNILLIASVMNNSLVESKRLVFSNEQANTISTGEFVIDIQDYENEIELKFGNNIDASIIFDRTADKFVINRDLQVKKNFLLDGAFLDSNGDPGILGQILSSTVTGTDWIYASSGSSLPINCANGEILKWNSTSAAWECDSDAGALIPTVDDEPISVEISTTQDIIIKGDNFTPTSIVSIPGWPGSINTTTITSSTEIILNVTASATIALYDVVVSNNGVSNTNWAGNGVNIIDVHPDYWKDLRLGGDVFTDGNGAGNDIRYRSGMSMTRDANGMSFAGSNPWSSWVKFESLGWTRGDDKTLEWIFTNPTGTMMIGIGSDATNESSTAQYAQAEIEAYFTSATNLWGLYGNNGTVGGVGNQSSSATIPTGGVYKVVFTSDGDAGDTFTLYKLPSANKSDWDDTTTILKTLTIGGSLNPNESNIMPFIIPRSGAQKFIAVKVE